MEHVEYHNECQYFLLIKKGCLFSSNSAHYFSIGRDLYMSLGPHFHQIYSHWVGVDVREPYDLQVTLLIDNLLFFKENLERIIVDLRVT